MDVVLPVRVKNEQKFFDCAFKLGFDEMSVHKFLFMFHQSDLDTFQKMGDERITVLIYSWELCEDYKTKLNDDEWELPEEMEMMLKLLVPWSLDVWFSKEWDRCKIMLRYGLIHCLNRARGLLMRMPDMMQINWDFLLLYNQTPWQVPYLKSMTVKKEKTLEMGGQTIEAEELPATDEDLKYTKTEQLSLIVLRLIKLFDQGSIDMVKTLGMRVISAWNKIYHTELETSGTRLPYVPPEDKRCLLLICHIYLMAIYEADDVKGYVIDNMINNIRFYYQGFQSNTSSYAMDNLSYTPARFIALTCIHLRLQKRELFDFFIWNTLDTLPVNLSGVVAQAYKSYLLGNLLMELNNMNEDDFAANAALYKRLMNSYVNEREKSEMFMIGEMQKLEAQHYAHNIHDVQPLTDFKNKICKGNRMSNIGNYENVDDVMNHKVAAKVKKEINKNKNELSVDPIFQNIPNNEDILYYVYDVLAKKSYRGWQFAKIVLLFKIISHELNMLETWRYHPGLTTNFMLNLETKLSQHYIDLAKIFKDYPFMEQEFWLTAFYLNPTHQSYEAVKRLGIRFNRKRNEEPTGNSSIEAKYGLLSSTIDVKEIMVLANNDEPNSDYIPLSEALQTLHLPDSVIKDILTVVFLPRNKSFSWAVEWNDLRRRCKMLMSNVSEKKRFVELTMAEANDRLKFLNIDYEKYKNRPQLDYGSIEQGYENLMNSADLDHDSDVSEEEDDFEDDEDVYESQKTPSRGSKKQEEVVEDDNSQEDDPYLVGRRRTRARTAAAMASLLNTTELTTRGKRRRLEEEAARELEEKLADNEDKSNDSKLTDPTVQLTPSVTDDTTSETPEIQKRNIKECLNERPLFSNSTTGFQPLVDMWNIEKSDLQVIDGNCVSLLESSSILNRFAKLKSINKQINPTGAHEEEQIDEKEMLIANGPIVIKVEKVSEVKVGAVVILDVQPQEEQTGKMEVLKKLAPALEKMDVVEQESSQDDDTNCDDVSSGRQVEKETEIEIQSADNTKPDERDEGTPSDDLPPKSIEQTKLNKNMESVDRSEQISSMEVVKETQAQGSTEKDCPSASVLTDTQRSLEAKTNNDEDDKELDKYIATVSTKPVDSSTFENISIIKDEKATESLTEDVIMKDLADVSKNTMLDSDENILDKIDDVSKLPNNESNMTKTDVRFVGDEGRVLLKELKGKEIATQATISDNISADTSMKSQEQTSKSGDGATLLDSTDKQCSKETVLEEVLAAIVLPTSDNAIVAEPEIREIDKNETEIIDHFDMSLLIDNDETKEVSTQDVDMTNVLDNKSLPVADKISSATTESESETNKSNTEDFKTAEDKPEILKSKDVKDTLDIEQNKSSIDQSSPKENIVDVSPIESEDCLPVYIINENIADETEIVDESLVKSVVVDLTCSTESDECKSLSIVNENTADETAIYDESEETEAMGSIAAEDCTSKIVLNEDVAKTMSMGDARESAAKECKSALEDIEATETTKDNKQDEENKHSIPNKETTINDNDERETSLDKECLAKEDVEVGTPTKSEECKSESSIMKNVAKDTAIEYESLAKETAENIPTISAEECKKSVVKESVQGLIAINPDELPSSSSTAIIEQMAYKSTEDDKDFVKEKSEDMTSTVLADCKSKSVPNDIVAEKIPTDYGNTVDLPTTDSEEIESVLNEDEQEAAVSSVEPDENENTPADDIKSDNDDAPGSLISLEISTLDAEKNQKTINTYTANIPYLHSDESKSAFEDIPKDDKQLVDMPSLDSEESKCGRDESPVPKTISDMPLLYSEESKSNMEETIVPTNVPDMPSLDSEESKSNLVAALIDQSSVDNPCLDADDNTNLYLHDMASLDSEESQSLQDLKNEDLKMKLLCLTKPLRVLIRRLRPSDLEHLRQPKVRVKRVRNAEAVSAEYKSKRRRLHRKVYIDIDESSDSLMSNSSSSWEAHHSRTLASKLLAKRQRLSQTRNSDSDCDSHNSLQNVRKRRLSTPNGGSSNHSNKSARSDNSRPSTATGNLVVTPRSASGLKLRISHADQATMSSSQRQKAKPVIVVDEIIQVSSSSFDSNTMDSVVEVPEDEDPLYEEAVIELHKSS